MSGNTVEILVFALCGAGILYALKRGAEWAFAKLDEKFTDFFYSLSPPLKLLTVVIMFVGFGMIMLATFIPMKDKFYQHVFLAVMGLAGFIGAYREHDCHDYFVEKLDMYKERWAKKGAEEEEEGLSGTDQLHISKSSLIASPIVAGLYLRIAGKRYPLLLGETFTATQIPGLTSVSNSGIVAEVKANPAHPKAVGLKNQSQQIWQVTLPGGKTQQLTPGQTIELLNGAQFWFGQIAGAVV